MMYVPVLFLMFSVALCAPEHVAGDGEHSPERLPASEHIHERASLSKRSPQYDFGLGKRMYSYVSEYKRLPVYNFGLGKRSRPYSFGLGKRSADEDAPSDDELVNNIDQEDLTDLINEYEDPGYEEKRARPYSFGLGKRFDDDIDISEEKRARGYDFGLGKRVPLYNFGLGKRAKSYNFGLGKRLSKFNFGLGKRQRDLHRFSFGLGKRSVDLGDDENDDIIDA